ncbi:MAG: hypothetical protein HQM00_00880 [Magnetococcales bacterium]|nr:hypothetical protein [Magnetococcales bacterium]
MSDLANSSRIRPGRSDKINLLVLMALFLVWSASFCLPRDARSADRKRILIVSSYHREYRWSQETQRGLSTALLDLGYLEDPAQAETLIREDRVESSRVVIRKLWMDTKRKSEKSEIAKSVARILDAARQFQPDLLLLGDDNATHYIGSHYLDTPVPVVYWGINIWPLRYGLLDSVERPGHNVTGVYQPGYLRESLEFLVELVPTVQTLAVLGDDSETSLAKIKDLHRQAESGQLPVRLVATVVTNNEAEWKAGALELAKQADAIYLSNHNTIKDQQGRPVDSMSLGGWYLRHVRKPDVGDSKLLVEEGVLCAADDSGFKQGFEAMRMADRILAHGADPATLPPVAPSRGPIVVNAERARMLGIDLTRLDRKRIEERVEEAAALKQTPEPP